MTDVTPEELCEACARPNHPIAWHVPDELWLVVVGRSSGFLCIPCFTDLARTAGIEISWIGSRFDISDSETWVISNQMNLDAEVAELADAAGSNPAEGKPSLRVQLPASAPFAPQATE